MSKATSNESDLTRNLGLFSESEETVAGRRRSRPLADRLRPQCWESYQGLDSLDANLINQLKSGVGNPPSLILWGPPGSGKTTFARLVGKSFKCQFVECSAVLTGVKEIRDIAAQARRMETLTILFVDEIHRLNKGQQDAFLPHVENGTFVLIGATTENPSFYLNMALLSRMRVLVLGGLTEDGLSKVAEQGAEELALKLSDGAKKVLCACAGGDARRLLNLLESYRETGSAKTPPDEVTAEDIESFVRKAGVAFYDRAGEEHYNQISAFIKSMRGSDPDAALYWAFRMLESGEDARFVFRRMIVFAAEDIGNADPRALQIAVTGADAFERLGLPEGRIPLAQCVTYLACAPKSNRSYMAMHKAIEAVKQHPKVSVPVHLRNAPTGLMKSLGYGQEYQYPHDFEKGYVPGVQYLPDELAGEKFYEPADRGAESAIRERLEYLRKLPVGK